MRAGESDLETLADDLDRALGELAVAAGEDPARWERGRPGKWTAGRHVAHVGIVLARTADRFEAAEQQLRAGTLPPPPARGAGQSLWVWLVAGRGWMPRGGRTAAWAVPPEGPERTVAVEALRRGAARHRQLAERLAGAERGRLWIANPFMERWHYRLPEMIRVHAVHARHHARLVAEIAPRR